MKGQDPGVERAENIVRKSTDPAYKGEAKKHMDTLLYGPPGTGKSMMYKCLINALQEYCTFIEVDRFDTHDASYFPGLFEYANTRVNEDGTPRQTYVIIDELERVVTDTAKVRNNTIKNAWQGIASYPNMTLIATTNFREKLPQAIVTRFQDPIKFNPRTTEMVAAILKDKCDKATENTFTMSDADYKEVAKGVEPLLQDRYCPREIWEMLIIKAAEYACSEGIDITMSHFQRVLGTMNEQVKNNAAMIRDCVRSIFNASTYGTETALYIQDAYNLLTSDVKNALGFQSNPPLSVWTKPTNTSADHQTAVAKLVSYLGDASGKGLMLMNSTTTKKRQLSRQPDIDTNTNEIIGYQESLSAAKNNSRQYVIGVGFKPCWKEGSKNARCIETARHFGFKETLLTSTAFLNIPVKSAVKDLTALTFASLIMDYPEPMMIAQEICHMLRTKPEYFDSTRTVYQLVEIREVLTDSVHCCLRRDVLGTEVEDVWTLIPLDDCIAVFEKDLLRMGDENAKKVLAYGRC